MDKAKIAELVRKVETFRLDLCKAVDGLHGEECVGCPLDGVCNAAILVWAKLVRLEHCLGEQ